MNRRSLFKLLAGAACAAAIELTGLRPLMPKAAQCVLNPEYVNAAYEDIFILSSEQSYAVRILRHPQEPLRYDIDLTLPGGVPMSEHAFVVGSHEALHQLPRTLNTLTDSFSPRYNFKDGQYVQVPQYILQA
jgi:hypothetical protein